MNAKALKLKNIFKVNLKIKNTVIVKIKYGIQTKFLLTYFIIK